MEKSTDDLFRSLKQSKSYEEFYNKEIGELWFDSLSEYLTSLLSIKKLTRADVINKSNLDKIYAHQIFSGEKKHPSRDKLIMIAFGMGLDLSETMKLLRIAGVNDLYVRMPRDSVIMFCLHKKKSLIETNEMLFEAGLDILK